MLCGYALLAQVTDSSDFKSAKLFKVQYLGKAAHFFLSTNWENMFREKVEFCIGMKLTCCLKRELRTNFNMAQQSS